MLTTPAKSGKLPKSTVATVTNAAAAIRIRDKAEAARIRDKATAGSKPPAPKAAARKAAAAPSFAHLMPAVPFDDEPDAPASPAKASAIVAAAAKARGKLPVAKPGKDTLAASILAAGRKARSATGAPAEPTGTAAQIIAAGRKRRGEV